MASIEVEDLSVTRGGGPVLRGISLRVEEAERVVLLGPSGSGKTTLLRAIAGVEPLAAGRVRIGGRDVTGVPPRDRDVAMVDQQASLQPHLDVRRNVGFPLALRRVPASEVDARVTAEARAFSFRNLLGRTPRSLSTGQRHEVALARSLVRRASVLLLDEPFVDHDAQRRTGLVQELLEVQQGYGVSLLCATNDQRIAMTLGMRCAVLDGGRLVQVAPPATLFARPVDVFVAGLVGTPPMNLVPGRVERASGGVRIVAGPLRLQSFVPAVSDLAGQACIVGIRPTDLRRARAGDVAVVEEPVHGHAFLGGSVEVQIGAGEQQLVAHLERPGPDTGELVRLAADPGAIHLFRSDGIAVAHGV